MKNVIDDLHPAGPQQRRWGLAVGVAATVAVTGALSFMAVVNHGGEKASSKDIAVATMTDAASYKSNGPADVVLEVGGRLRAAENERVRRLFAEDRLPAADPLLATVAGKRAYLCMDAAKAHLDGAWHDIKVATFYEAEGTSCVRKTYKAGQAVVEAPGLLHTTKNEGKRDLEYLVYSMHPKGTDLGIPQPRPADCHH